MQQISKLQEELITTRTQVQQLETLAKDNPQLPILRQKVGILENAITAETERVTGGVRSLAGKAAQYQQLVLEREFADKMLATALVSLEQARNEAQRKQLYLERAIQPSLPDQAMEPKRLRGIAATFIIGLLVFAVMSMLLAGVREHMD
ncbi:hypothetical protein [Deefgea sp. CFH1-16]|uniref:hypothetical protein n=1 Tax=Deefgea sp. CFH1-16 TaxID=2675457 RepID=UPI0019402F9B|nr:hypothetical protein [Deefgea sp. CFH1-16]